jgi:oligoendopeptidase F
MPIDERTFERRRQGMNRGATTDDASDDLPRWALDDLYPGPDSPELAADLRSAAEEAASFRQRHRGTLAFLSGKALALAIAEYERLRETLARIDAFATLLRSGAMTDPTVAGFYQTVSERTTAIGRDLLFFALELNRIDDAALEAKLGTPALDHYRSWLRDIRASRRHLLSDEIEALLLDKAMSGRVALVRLYDEMQAAGRFPIGGRDRTHAEAFDLLRDADRTVRKDAADALAQGLADSAPPLALIYNTLAKDKAVEDRWRGFDRPISPRNQANFVEDDVVEALIGAVKSAYPRLSHRYYRLKAGWLGLERLEHWDRQAPLPADASGSVPWNTARRLVLDSYREFSPALAALAERFFTHRWIDAAPRPGKAYGAFADSTVPSVHPYVQLNYFGRCQDVMTLSHELGHGVHYLLASARGQLVAELPLTLMETASVFGEMLTFRRLLAAETDPGRRRLILAHKVEAMLHTTARQIALVDFERRFHDERGAGEVTAARIGEIWLETQQAYLGDAVRLGADYAPFWTTVWHFFRTPFYVYAYAFGECLATSLYAAYQQAPEGFAERYLDLLAAGGMNWHDAALAPFGLDTADPAFWNKGLSVIEGFIDELEETAPPIAAQ